MFGVRIALLAPLVAPLREPQMGGVQTHLVDLALGLRARGHAVTVYASTGSGIDGVAVADTGVDAERLGATLFRPGLEHPGASEADAAFAIAAALIARGDHDVVHNHAFDVAAIRHLTALSIPVAHTLHLPPAPAVARALALARRGDRPPTVVAVSGAQARSWRRFAAIDAVIRPGLPVASIPWSATSTTDLLFAGRLSPEKGAVEAVAIARAAGLPLLLRGQPYDPAYARRLRPLVDGTSVRLMEALPRAGLWVEMGRVGVVLCPAGWEEPFGLVSAEANACGTPVVGFRCGGLPEVVAQGVSGFLVGDGDISAAALAVHRALDLSRDACRRHAETTLDLGPELDAHERLYGRLTSA